MAVDAGPEVARDAVFDTTIDAPHVFTGSAMSHVVYLATEGAAITTAAADDATLNQSSVARNAATLKPFLMDDATRQNKIDSIVAEARMILSPYDIRVVTTRPTSGRTTCWS